MKSFLDETLARLPAGFRLYALRADSGFFISEFLLYLEEHLLPYVIAVRMNPHIKRAVTGLRQWRAFAPGLEAAETTYQALGWTAPRRLVVVREELRERPEARARRLIEVPGYTFHVLVTTLAHDPVETWHFYNSRADSENRLKGAEGRFRRRRFLSAVLQWHPSRLPPDLLFVQPDRRLQTRRYPRRVCAPDDPAHASTGGWRHSWVRRAQAGFALGTAAPGASALPRCSNASLSLHFQLWRNLSPMKKTTP